MSCDCSRSQERPGSFRALTHFLCLPCRGKCSRGASCRYSHIDPRLLASPLAAAGINPALLAAGLGTAAMVGQPPPLAPGGLPSLGGLPGGMSDVAQAQAALLLSAGLPLPGATSTSDSISAWPGSAAAGLCQQAGAADAYTLLLDHMQRANLAEALGGTSAPPVLTPVGSSNVSSMAALSALLGSAPPPPPRMFGAATSPSSCATPPDLANLLQAAAPAPCTDASLYPQPSAASDTATGSLSAAATPTAAATTTPTPFQQVQQQGQEGPQAPAPAPIATKPLVPIYHGVLSKGPGTADLLASTRETDSPTIGAAWGAAAAQQRQLHEASLQQSLLAASSQQQHLQAGHGRLPPPPGATTSGAAAGELPTVRHSCCLPHQLPCYGAEQDPQYPAYTIKLFNNHQPPKKHRAMSSCSMVAASSSCEPYGSSWV